MAPISRLIQLAARGLDTQPTIQPPFQNSSFTLDSSGVAGFFGGDGAVQGMATVHLFEGRRWFGWYNTPGSYEIAKQYGQLANSRLWDGLFPGPNRDPAQLFGLDGQAGPPFLAAHSGSYIQRSGHLAHLITRRVQSIPVETCVRSRRRSGVSDYTVATIDLRGEGPPLEMLPPRRKRHLPWIALVPITPFVRTFLSSFDLMLVAARLGGAILASVVASLTRTTAAALVNRTIDDQRGDSVTGQLPSKSPANKWAFGQLCPHCGIPAGSVVDPKKVFQGTWSDSTYHPGLPDHVINASFTGTAVYVYNLIVNIVPEITTETNLSFSVDGTYMGQYIHFPSAPPPLVFYNVCVFSFTELPNQAHLLEVRATGPSASLILFDYIVYSTFDESSTPSNTIPILQSSTILPSRSPAASSHVSTVLHSSDQDLPAPSVEPGTHHLSSLTSSPAPSLDGTRHTSSATPISLLPSNSPSVDIPIASPSSTQGPSYGVPTSAITGGVAGALLSLDRRQLAEVCSGQLALSTVQCGQ
ncbi:hypothetical protein NUW54_g10930 [Trametes sanguinea]|uniref:Uncharacterized protein n=1 Tax=Trametes sanguinea TaxID=158606 RepID=A0ACC1NNZ7_9APHY|nr:hypothetical protein NUW54_g10930 [Trametes sanguinea]